MTMLYQIERRQREQQEAMKMLEVDLAETKAVQKTGAKTEGKVIAIVASPELYAQLQEVSKKHGARGVRAALMLAAKTGIRQLLG